MMSNLPRPATMALLLAAGLAPFLARAQTAAPKADTDGTELSLDAEGRATASPDQLTATLFAQVTSGNLAAAQSALNTTVTRADKAAATHTGVDIARADYTASQSSEKPVRWTAQQTIILREKNATDGGKAVLDAVADLQALGLGVSGLEWSVSPERHDTLLETARRHAIENLRAQAAACAQAMSLHIGRYKLVRLTTSGGMRPPVMLMSARMAASPTPPESTPQSFDVTVDAQGTVILAP